MLWAKIVLLIEEGEETLDDTDCDKIEINDALVALEEALPELPKGAKWRVES